LIYTACTPRWKRFWFLEKVDPDAAKQARSRYSCFDHFGEDAQSYGYAASYDERFSCEDEAVKQLVELQRRAAEYANRDGFVARDDTFSPSKTRDW
jgi:erythromycin esterase-like protein